MKVLLDIADAGLREELLAEFEEAGFSTEELQHQSGNVAVVLGARRADETARKNPALRVVALIAPAEFDLLSTAVAGFAVVPPCPGEVTARVKIAARSIATDEEQRARLLATAVESAGDVIEIASPEPRLQYVNPAYQQVLGFTLDEVVGKTPAELIRSDQHTPEYFQNLDATLKRGEVWTGLLVSRARDGRLVHFDCTIAPVHDLHGRITHHVAVKRDITERLKREQALEQTNRALEKAKDAALAASRSKSEFLANMSHELRTPLNAIIGYSELMMEDAQDAGNTAAISDLDKIKSAGTQLLDLINDVLDISKIEAGKMDVFVESFDLGPMLDNVLSTVRPAIEARNNVLSLEMHQAQITLRADQRKVRQILMNLLGNAAKFTNAGRVTLRVREETADGKNWVTFEVEDTGIGISQEKQRKLFRPFTQADASTTRRYGGTGLGLVISKRFSEMMGGSITLRSEVDQGSVFTVRIPASVEVQHRRSSSTFPRVRPGSNVLLLIDDDTRVRDELQEMLRDRDVQLVFANRGDEGLTLAKQLKPSLIVLDVLMPEMDGWSVLTALKVDADTAAIPVFMLTISDQKELGMALGAVEYFVKPVEPARLLSAIRRVLRNKPPKDSEVLVVEDDGPTRELIRRTLNDAGYQVVEAENGKEGLDRVASRVPDFIVLDLMMPEVDGFDFLDRLRNKPGLRTLPVMVVTAKLLTSEERERLQRSAQRVIEKNAHTRQQLLKIIGEQVGNMLTNGS